MSTTYVSPVTSPVLSNPIAGMSAAGLAMLAPLVSLVVPGLGLALYGRVRAGSLVLAGFAVSTLIPVPAVAVSAMFAFWLWGLTALYDGRD